MKTLFEQLGGTYTMQGDYRLPNLIVEETDTRPIGVWGQRRLHYLKHHRKVLYYESKITVLRYALEQYTNFDTDGDIPESVIEAFVEKIEVSKDCFRWHLRGDFGGDSPIPMNVDGNRKKGATISPQYIIPPANFGDSGRHQGQQVIALL